MSLIKYEIQKHVENDPESSFTYIGFWDKKIVNKSEYLKLKEEGWYLVRKRYFLLTALLINWNRLNLNQKIAVTGIVVPSAVAIILFLLTSTQAEMEEQPKRSNTYSETAKLSNLEFDPHKSDYFIQISIYPEVEMNKDTFNVGDTLTATLFLSEEVQMLKNMARKEGLKYRLNFQYDSLSDSGAGRLVEYNEKEKAFVTFITTLNSMDKTELVDQHWSFGIRFEFLNEDRIVYDTTFKRLVRYKLVNQLDSIL